MSDGRMLRVVYLSKVGQSTGRSGVSDIGATEFELWNRGGWPRVDVVGEKFHEDEIRRLFPGDFQSGSRQYEGFAHLIPEPDNPHDPNAIAIKVEGNLVGYLARELATRYVDVMKRLVARGSMPTTNCQIWAYEHQDWLGTDRRGNDIYRPALDARASLVLDEPHLCVPANLPPNAAYKILPHGSALQVKGEEEHLDVLAPFVQSYGEAWTYATLHVIAVESGRSTRQLVELRLDGQAIGQLTPAMSAHFARVIEHLEAGGRLLTVAKVMLKGNPIQVEAVLYAAKAHELDASWIGESQRPAFPTAAAPAMTSLTVADPQSSHPPAPAVPGKVSIPPKPSRIAFRAPPGWPPPPADWEPFPGWQPDPDWPRPPEDWAFWVIEGTQEQPGAAERRTRD